MLLAATGHVRAYLGTRKIQGDTLRYDFTHNTALVAGNVQVITANGVFAGTAYVLDLTLNTATLLKLAPIPATFSLRDDDIADAVEEPSAPNTFKVTDLGAELPYIVSTRADIIPNASVRLTPARFPVNAKLTIASPSYMYVFAPNPAFGVTPPTLPAASFDQPYGLIGTTHSLLAAHLRYSTTNGITTSLDEHLVDGTQRYFVASFEPQDRHVDIDGFEQLRAHLTQNFTGSLANDEKTARYVLQHTSKLITTTLTLSQFTTNIVSTSTPNASPTPANINGASYASDDLQINTVTRSLGHIASYKLRTDFGYDNISGQLPYEVDFRTTLGGSLYTPSIHGPLKTNLSGEYDFSSTHYDYPHQYATSTMLFTLARRINRTLSFYGNASFTQLYNRYGTQGFTNAQIINFLGLFPNPTQPVITPDGTPYPGYAAYNGITTQRTYLLTTTIAPSPNFNLLLSLTETCDFPQFHGFGRTPLTTSFDLRIRPMRTIAVEFGRSYIFGWDLQHLTPQYTLGIAP
jgi:hypothetical protein